MVTSPDTTAPDTTAPTATAPPTTTVSTWEHITCTYPATVESTEIAERLQDRIARAVAAHPANLAVTVHDWTHDVSCSLHGTTRFDSASVIKATTVATLLWQAQRADRDLTSTEENLATEAITVSDNDAESALWSRVGGSSGVQEFLDAADMPDTEPHAGGSWGLSRITTDDQVVLLDHLARSDLLTTKNSQLELSLMREVVPEQRWGVPSGAPTGTQVAVKNGWLSESDSQWYVHSIGYVTGDEHEYTIAVLSDGSPTMDDGVDAVEEASSAVHSVLT
jgi:beta-lactamase class A